MNAIKTFKDIIDQIELPERVVNNISANLGRSMNGAEVSFTGLQETAFNNDKYWIKRTQDPFPPHLIVQGATSSGKTLVSEMTVVECCYDRPPKKAIILVPLKAMVRERCEHFAEDLPDKRVYASSSDFQDHDMDIIGGHYDVAVIVYEKFFAMISQPSNRILEECALVVVDELQMLSSEGRGPKLEISIQKIMRHNAELGTEDTMGTYTRIMCLTTYDCEVKNIKRWLTVDGKEPECIKNGHRPVGLKEYVLCVDGKLRGIYNPGERDDPNEETEFKEYPPQLEVAGYNKNNKIEQSKQLVLKELLKKVCSENPEVKILVFVSNRRHSREIARYIAEEKFFGYNDLTEEVIEAVDQYDNDENQNEIKSLLPYKIAFHNSSVSTALREYIEKAFEFNGNNLELGYPKINLVVATETLTIGMNMPVDVMILYDSRVPRGSENPERLTSQEYKNFVGRAGRLGLSNYVGQSYIISLDEAESLRFWDDYIKCKMENIKSALIGAQEKVQAPYYLSLLTHGKQYQIKALNALQENSFSRKCGGKNIEMKKMMRILKKASLCFEVDDVFLLDDEEDNKESYQMGEFGGILAPYALSLETSYILHRFFLNGGYIKQDGKFLKPAGKYNGGVPSAITAEDIENDRYLLDILYILCTTPEVKRLSVLRISRGESASMTKTIIYNKLKDMTDKKNNGNDDYSELWPDSKLYSIINEESNTMTEDLQAAMRAIFLWYWTKGKTVREIKNKTKGFVNGIYAGDLTRLAEVVSYELDAIYRCVSHLGVGYKIKYDGRSQSAIYSLSTRVNYGMPRNLVIIANRHIYGLDRSTVLKIGKGAKDYESPVKFLMRATTEELKGIITEQQREMLLSTIDKIYFRDDFASLLSNIEKNPKSKPMPRLTYDSLIQLNSVKEGEEENVPEILDKIFCPLYASNNDGGSDNKFFSDNASLILSMAEGNKMITLDVNNVINGRTEKVSINIGVYNEKSADHIITQFRHDAHKINLLLVTRFPMLENIQPDNEHGCYKFSRGGKEINNISLAMTIQSFAVLIAQAIALDDQTCSILSEFLCDVKGELNIKNSRELYYMLKNYDVNYDLKYDQELDTGCINLLCDYRNDMGHDTCEKLISALKSKGIRFKILRWGSELKNTDHSRFTALYITNDSLKTDSMHNFYQKIKQHDFKNVYAVFDTVDTYKNLSNNPQFPEGKLQYDILTDPMQKAEYINIHRKLNNEETIENNQCLIGVSYSHTPTLNGAERPAVTALKKIVCRLNDSFGEYRVLFDDNESYRDEFTGNGASNASLELYEKCRYFVILDDKHYDDGENCPKEADVIIKKRNREEYRQHIWYLRPINDRSSSIFNREEDFCEKLDYDEKTIKRIADMIKRIIYRDINAKDL